MNFSFYDFFEVEPQAGVVFSLGSKQIVSVNPAFCSISGFEKDDVLKKPLNEVLQNLPESISAGKYPIGFICKNNSILKATAVIVINPHKSIGVIFLREIIKENKSFFHLNNKNNILQLSNYIDDLVWTTDTEGKFTFVSPKIIDLLGYLPNEIIGKSIKLILSPSSYKNVTEILQKELQKKDQYIKNEQGFSPITKIELEQIKKDGVLIRTEVFISIILDENGDVFELIGITKDISGNRESEKNLFQIKEQYEQILELTSEASALINKAGFIISANKALADITGFTLDSIIGKHFTQVPFFDIKQIPEYIKIFSNLVRGKDIKPYRYTWNDANGFNHHGIVHLALVKKNGEIIGIQAITSDITKQIEIEKVLLENEEKYQAIFHNSPLGIFHFDINGIITECNTKFEEILGSDRTKLIGLNLLKDIKDQQMIEAVRETLTIGKATYENIYKAISSKKEVPVRLLFNGFRNSQNEIIGGIGLVEDITHRSNAENALKTSEKKFRSLFEHSPMGMIYFDKAGQLLDCNEKMADILGIHKEDIIKKNIYNEIVNDEITKEISKSLTEGTGFYANPYQSVSINKVSNVRAFFKGITDINGVITHGIGIVEDLTEWYKTERQLKESTQKLIFAIQSAGFGLWEMNIETNEIIISPEFLSQIGVKNKFNNTTYNDWLELIHPDERQTIKNQFNRYLRGQNQQYIVEFRIITEDGSNKWLLSSGKITEYNTDKKPVKIVGVHSDITNLRRMELELIEKNTEIALQNEEYVAINEELHESFQRIQAINQELILAKNKAEENDKLKTAFLQNMSHEIRTPMNGIMGFAQLLELDHSSSEKRKEYVKVINESCQQLLNIVNDILDISRIETGQMTVNIKQTDLVWLLDGILQFFKPMAAQNSLQLFLNIPDSKQFVVNTDTDKLRQVLNNLLSNALKYTNQGSVHFGYIVSNGFVEFYVRDTGPGIKPEYHNFIFERFIQAHNTATKRYAGTGLGLPISKGLVNLLGGRIWVESEPGTGSTFHFTIPIGTSESILSKQKQGFTSGFPTILIAEDQESNFFLVKEMLQHSELNILRAKDGEEAVALFRENPQIQLVLMDIKMPNMDGYQATQIIRGLNKKIPIIAQTAYAMADDRDKVINSGCTDYISKPFNKKTLLEIIAKYLKKS
jgi:PAS domain S-box-containing protein